MSARRARTGRGRAPAGDAAERPRSAGSAQGSRRGAGARPGCLGARRRLAAGAFAAGLAALLAGLLGCSPPEVVTACEARDGRRPVCGFSNPEDLAPAGGGWILVSQFPQAPDQAGRLVAWHPERPGARPLFPAQSAELAPREGAGDASCPGPPDPTVFAPHGIDVVPGHAHSTLWVVNHGGRESVERFRLEARPQAAPRLVWEGCVPLPDEAQANDLVGLADGGFAVTWFLPRTSGVALALAFGRVALGLDTGRVLHWRPGEGFRTVPGSEASAPNGIEVSPDGRTLFVAAWGDEALLRLPLVERVEGVEGAEGAARRTAPLPHHPDNLTWTADGRLLVAGQEGTVGQVAGCTRITEGACAMAWSVLEVDPRSLESRLVVREDPARTTGAASVALESGDEILVGTFAGDRLVRVPR